MLKKISVLILFVVVLHQTSYAQYKNIASRLFLGIHKLDSIVDIDNIDTNLVNLGVLHYTNEHRKKKNLKKLLYNLNLQKSAFLHSTEMKEKNFFDHINRRNSKLRDLDDRAKVAKYKNFTELAENLYYGYIDLQNRPTYRELVKTITQAFIDSRNHNKNLLDKDMKEMGCAIVFKTSAKNGFHYYYFTQSFGSRY